jgi:hypothetical protein
VQICIISTCFFVFLVFLLFFFFHPKFHIRVAGFVDIILVSFITAAFAQFFRNTAVTDTPYCWIGPLDQVYCYTGEGRELVMWAKKWLFGYAAASAAYMWIDYPMWFFNMWNGRKNTFSWIIFNLHAVDTGSGKRL